MLLCVALQGCSNNKGFSSFFSSVTLKSTDNALRFDLICGFNSSCTYSIEIWKQGERENARTIDNIKGEMGQLTTTTLSFLYPDTNYELVINAEDRYQSKLLSFKTGQLPPDIPQYKIVENNTDMHLDGYLLQWEGSNPGYVTFCDWDGNIVWYQAYGKGIRTAHYDPNSGQLAILMGFQAGANPDSTDPFYRLASDIIVSDLDGNILHSWNPRTHKHIRYPHHEFRILPDGKYLILQNVVKNYNGLDIYGEGFCVFDQNGNILFDWDSFREINPDNTDYLDTQKFATDYIHANSVNMDSKGNFYFTVNRLSELWKIDGKTGEVLYRLGKHGNISLNNAELPGGGLHAAEVLSEDRVLCYDNGRDRSYSKGVLYAIDPAAKQAQAELEIVLPSEYSSENRSNAQKIEENLYLLSSTVSGKAIFANGDGEILKVIGRTGISYRAYWYKKI